jgi:hypothetical protein
MAWKRKEKYKNTIFCLQAFAVCTLETRREPISSLFVDAFPT